VGYDPEFKLVRCDLVGLLVLDEINEVASKTIALAKEKNKKIDSY
jgi:hypothetical protein